MIAILFSQKKTTLFQKVKRILRFFFNVKNRTSSLEMVNFKFKRVLEYKGIKYKEIHCINELLSTDLLICLGTDINIFRNFNRDNPIVAGIGLMTHPTDHPWFFQIPSLKVYLQHSDWTCDIYKEYTNLPIEKWPAPIDIEYWKPDDSCEKEIDFIVYEKFLFENDENQFLLTEILRVLTEMRLSYISLKYGNYNHMEYRELLNKSKALIFLCEHESQGFAYQEALSMNVPILAWNQGSWLDPNYKNGPIHEASSVPFFDQNCGMTFINSKDFHWKLTLFLQGLGKYKPRNFIINHLSANVSGEIFCKILDNHQLSHFIEFNTTKQ